MNQHEERESDRHERRYQATIYVAAPNTPIIDPDSGRVVDHSVPGHMYYSISDGQEQLGYGFAPKGHGMPVGPGEVSTRDFERYQNPAYARTIEITPDQYDKLKEFGKSAISGDEKYFNTYYVGAGNSCIDFTWGALNHAGLHRQMALPFSTETAPNRDHEGRVLPQGSIADIKSINAPFPQSDLNREVRHPISESIVEQTARAVRDGAHALPQKTQEAKDGLLDKAGELLHDLKCEAFPKLPDCPPDLSQRVLPDPYGLY
jgi:hypothetical protein